MTSIGGMFQGPWTMGAYPYVTPASNSKIVG